MKAIAVLFLLSMTVPVLGQSADVQNKPATETVVQTDVPDTTANAVTAFPDVLADANFQSLTRSGSNGDVGVL